MLRNLEMLKNVEMLMLDGGDQEGRLTSFERVVVAVGQNNIIGSSSDEDELFERYRELPEDDKTVALARLKNAVFVSDDFGDEDNLKDPQFTMLLDEAAIVKGVEFEKKNEEQNWYDDADSLNEVLDLYNVFGGTPVMFQVYDHRFEGNGLYKCLLVMGDLKAVYDTLSVVEKGFRETTKNYSRRGPNYEGLRTVNDCDSDTIIRQMYELLSQYPESQVVDITSNLFSSDRLNGGEICSWATLE